jgi:ABC-type nitrate/sulfonate/bicarbonate transport system substrate-binding protein
MRTFKIVRSSLAAIAAIVMVSSCSSGQASDGSTSGGSSGAAPSEVSIATSGDYLTIFAPFWAAEPELDAVADKFHTKFSYQPFGKGGDCLTALIGGSVEMSIGASPSNALPAAAQGKSLSYVANIFSGGGVVLVGAKKYESERGTDVAKYAGGAWGYTAEGSTSQVFLQASAEHSGVAWDKQKRIALGGMAGFEPALQSGRVDIVAMDSGSAAKSVKDGVGYVVLNTNDAKEFDAIGGRVLLNGIIVTDAFRQKYPEFMQAVVTALIQGLLKVRDVTDAEKAYALMPEAFQRLHTDKAQFAVEWELSQPAFVQTDGSMSPSAIANTEKLALKPEQVGAAGVKSLFDNTLVDAAYKSLNVPRPTTPSPGV